MPLQSKARLRAERSKINKRAKRAVSARRAAPAAKTGLIRVEAAGQKP